MNQPPELSADEKKLVPVLMYCPTCNDAFQSPFKLGPDTDVKLENWTFPCPKGHQAISPPGNYRVAAGLLQLKVGDFWTVADAITLRLLIRGELEAAGGPDLERFIEQARLKAPKVAEAVALFLKKYGQPVYICLKILDELIKVAHHL